jgi:membrane protein
VALADGRTRNDDGRDAARPSDIPKAGWKQIGKRVVASLKRDHVSLLAAGVAFKALLALFPAIIAGISLWGLVADPATVTRQIETITDALPDDAASLIGDQMETVAGGESSTLGLALIVSILIALWSASGGMAGLIEGINAAYDEVDRRKFPVKRGLALLLTVGAIIALLVAVGLIAVLPALLGVLGLGQVGELAVRIGTWPLLGALAIGGLALLYKVAPDRDDPQFRWTSWGAGVATLLWLLGSGAFTLYVENFGDFGATYGTFAGIIVLMLWLMLSSFIVLLGAEINAEMERQTHRDTTVGDPRPMGRRGADAADTTADDWEAQQERQLREDTTVDLRDEEADRTSGSGGLSGEPAVYRTDVPGPRRDRT